MRTGSRNRRLLTRLRFGYTGLSCTLFTKHEHDTGKCQYCGEFETMEQDF